MVRRGGEQMSRDELNRQLLERMQAQRDAEKPKPKVEKPRRPSIAERLAARMRELDAAKQSPAESRDKPVKRVETSEDRNRARLRREIGQIEGQMAQTQQRLDRARRRRDSHKEDWYKGLMQTLEERKARTQKQLDSLTDAE